MSADPIEAEARRLLRDLITRLPWHAGMSADEQAKRIEEDVDQWWRVKAEEAASGWPKMHPRSGPSDRQTGGEAVGISPLPSLRLVFID
jgi:hypothetical protein